VGVIGMGPVLLDETKRSLRAYDNSVLFHSTRLLLLIVGMC